jgi:hypothetical protein
MLGGGQRKAEPIVRTNCVTSRREHLFVESVRRATAGGGRDALCGLQTGAPGLPHRMDRHQRMGAKFQRASSRRVPVEAGAMPVQSLAAHTRDCVSAVLSVVRITSSPVAQSCRGQLLLRGRGRRSGTCPLLLLLACWCSMLQNGWAVCPNVTEMPENATFSGNLSEWPMQPCGAESQRRLLSVDTCPPGFTGPGTECLPCAKNIFSGECELECDMFVNCSGHGRCDGISADCACHAGWLGADCGEQILTQCPGGYTGFPECSPCAKNIFTGECDLECDMFVNCSGHGRCDGLTSECVCYTGWQGEICSSIDYTLGCPAGFTGTGSLAECLPCVAGMLISAQLRLYMFSV